MSRVREAASGFRSPIAPRVAPVAVAGLLALATLAAGMASASPVKAHDPNVSLGAFGTASIDGVLSPAEWSGAASVPFSVNLPEGGTTPGTLFVMNDLSNLYLAVRYERSADDAGGLGFSFDNDHDGGFAEEGDDNIGQGPGPQLFGDGFLASLPPCPPFSICGFFDTDYGGSSDGAGVFSSDGSFSIYELAHPLNSIDDVHDFSLNLGDTVGFALSLRLITYD